MAFRLQNAGHDRGAGGAIALSKEVFGRVPTLVGGEEACNKAGKRMRVGIDPPKSFFLVLAKEPAEAGAGRVDKDQVADVEQALGIVYQLIRSGISVLVVGGNDAPRTKSAHVQPHGGAARDRRCR